MLWERSKGESKCKKLIDSHLYKASSFHECEGGSKISCQFSKNFMDQLMSPPLHRAMRQAEPSDPTGLTQEWADYFPCTG